MPSATTLPVGEELLEPLRRTFRWLVGLRGADGRIVCPWHGVEHTGSNAGVIVLACEMLAHDPAADAELLRREARLEARRLCANLVREGTSACHTFRPGRHDPFNCSNSVIDGGAATDALSQFVRALGPELEPAERERCKDAALLHARTYLRYAVLDKGIPAQRAWGLAGVAGAWALERDDELERAALEAVGVLEGIQHADGSYPYHPIEWGAEHAGASDVSSFYQSRVTAFLFRALRDLGRDPAHAIFAPQLARGLDFARALQGPDGLKCGLVEAKPWYWGDAHEVASHPFDVYAFAGGARALGRGGDGLAALCAFRAWAERLAPDGRPRDHVARDGARASYQCPVFWAGHAAWIARALPELERARAADARDSARPATTGSGAGIDLALRWFPNAQLGRLEDGRVVAWVRGARPASNVNHGSPRGAGLVRVFDKRAGKDALRRERFDPAGEAEWTARGPRSFARGWRSGASELRFSLWTARVHARAGRVGAALAEPWRALREGVFEYADGRVASSFALTTEVDVGAFELALAGPLAWRDGTSVPGSRVERRFAVDGDGLEVTERVLDHGTLRGLDYALPAAARAVERGPASVRWRLP
ncbi:MAG: hypothetical protein IPJ77_16280 [Planctomycetes bacterium]|nr:hypothetical protein [Planctomycetota bacterium]